MIPHVALNHDRGIFARVNVYHPIRSTIFHQFFSIFEPRYGLVELRNFAKRVVGFSHESRELG